MKLSSLEDSGSIEETWTSFNTAVYESATATFGSKKQQNENWLEAHNDVFNHLVEKKHNACLKQKDDPSQGNLCCLYEAGSAVQ